MAYDAVMAYVVAAEGLQRNISAMATDSDKLVDLLL